MTDIFEDIRRDREAGTPGPWFSLPNMEAALLAAEKLVVAAQEMHFILETMEGSDGWPVQREARAALTAFRKAARGE